MAVVTHGSFDEGPIVLALPPVYEYAAAEETDPIFSAWDKSTGIEITESQITDLGDYITGNELTSAINEVYDVLDSTYATQQGLSNLVDLNAALYVPYEGANTNVDLGTNTLTAERVYANQETPASSLELVTKAYVDDLAFTGAGGISPTVAHNDTTGKEGGGSGHWYHLSAAQSTSVGNITNTSTIGDPTGLYLVGSGISVVAGHEAAYVDLAWDANVESNLGWYVVYYKQHNLLLWSELITYTNAIHIEGLLPSTDYDFAVAAANKMGQVTSMSSVLEVTTPGDSEAPAKVENVIATGLVQAVMLTWERSYDLDFKTFRVYRNTINSHSGETVVADYTGNKFIDNGLTANTTYYYWVKAMDRSDNLSTDYSDVVNATTRNVLATDIENIAASQVIIQGVTTLASWASPATTTIDGAKITTGSITLQQLNFTPIEGGSIVATLNASTEGLQINANLFSVSGATIFTKSIGGTYTSSNTPTTLSRVSIYTDANTGIKVTDDLGNQVFLVEIGGTNIGDVTIGKYTAGQGIWYDKSANITHFAGRIEASSGSISGLFDFGTQAVSYTGQEENIAIKGADIWENTANAHGSAVRINRIGYQGGNTRYRNFIVYDGENNQVLSITGSGRLTSIYGQLKIDTTTGGFIPPIVTSAQRLALSKTQGTIVFDSDLGRFCGVVVVGGVPQWWTFTMAANVS